MDAKKISNIVIEDAKIRFRNFAGKEGKFNPEGRRNFCVFIDPDLAEVLKTDGWNVKYLKPRNEDDDPQAYLSVAINYSYMPPKIWLITERNKVLLDEESLKILDWAEIEKADLIIRPYAWEVNGKSGIKAYVKSLHIKVVEDEFDEKYSEIPEKEEVPF